MVAWCYLSSEHIKNFKIKSCLFWFFGRYWTIQITVRGQAESLKVRSAKIGRNWCWPVWQQALIQNNLWFVEKKEMNFVYKKNAFVIFLVSVRSCWLLQLKPNYDTSDTFRKAKWGYLLTAYVSNFVEFTTNNDYLMFWLHILCTQLHCTKETG